MMIIVRIGLVTALVLAVFTVCFVIAHVYMAGLWRVKAIGLDLIFSWTVRSPLYWLMILAILAGSVWLLGRYQR